MQASVSTADPQPADLKLNQLKCDSKGKLLLHSFGRTQSHHKLPFPLLLHLSRRPHSRFLLSFHRFAVTKKISPNLQIISPFLLGSNP